MSATNAPSLSPASSQKSIGMEPKKPTLGSTPAAKTRSNVTSSNDFASKLVEANLRQMKSANNSASTARLPSSMSMPMGMSTNISQPPPFQQQQPMMMNSSFYPSPNNNMNAFTTGSMGMTGVPPPRSQTTFNLNSTTNPTSLGYLQQYPNNIVGNHKNQNDSNVKILSKQDIDDFLK